MDRDQITIVIVTLNQSSCLSALWDEVAQTCFELPYSFRILFVDDGSTDETPSVLAGLRKADDRVEYVILSRTVGRGAALAAGLAHATGDAVICTHTGRSQPFAPIPALLERWKAGFDIVNAAPTAPRRSPWMLQLLSRPFQCIVDWALRRPVAPVVADVGLISRAAIDILGGHRGTAPSDRWRAGRLREVRIDVPPCCSEAGGSSMPQPTECHAVRGGSVRSNFSPLRILVVLGWSLMLASGLFGGWVAVHQLAGHSGEHAWMYLFAGVIFCGGMQLAATGAVLDYLGRILGQFQPLPAYFIREAVTTGPVSSNRGELAATIARDCDRTASG